MELEAEKPIFKNLQKVAKKAYERLVEKGSYSPADIFEYSDLIQATENVFLDAIKTGVKDNQISSRTMEALKSDSFLVGGLKTHAQLFEADQLFLKNGRVKSFQELAYEMDKLNVKYNRNYMQAEYDFALGSAQAIEREENFIADKNGRYLFKYLTDNGPNVRKSHRDLEGITLPADDPFWSSYTPPNGWNCHCMKLQVRAANNTISNSEDANKKGDIATTLIGKDGKNRLEIFRYNPAEKKIILPPKHPYRANKCSENGKINMTGMLGLPMLFLSAEKDKCQVQKMLVEKIVNPKKLQRVEVRTWSKNNLIGKKVLHPEIKTPITFTMTGIDEALNQPHKHYEQKNESIKKIESLIENAKYLKKALNNKNSREMMHYLKTEIENEDSFIVIKENLDNKTFSFYSIVDGLKKKKSL